MKKEKILLIAGCSHTAGSEIDGNEDSEYNREHSFGGVIAKELGRKAINVAQPGATNSGIARQIMFWFKENYYHESMDVNVLIGWSESTRMEIPSQYFRDYQTATTNADWYDQSAESYFKVIIGWNGHGEEEKLAIPLLHRFMVENQPYLEIASYNSILQIQYFLKSHNVDYLMCDTMPRYWGNQLNSVKKLMELIDETKYFKLNRENQAFYVKYKNLGYVNEKAKDWHHNEEPHRLYAAELFKFSEVKQCLRK